MCYFEFVTPNRGFFHVLEVELRLDTNPNFDRGLTFQFIVLGFGFVFSVDFGK